LPPTLSIIVPLHNEADNVRALIQEVEEALAGEDYELLLVDDGSSDGTYDIVEEEAAQRPRLRGIKLYRQFGQTAAQAAGIEASSGEFIVTMDGDLQNDPQDVLRLLEKLHEGWDVVSGWRAQRRDSLIVRRLPSAVANWLISRISGLSLHDYGCALKAYRSRTIKGVDLRGDVHRFIPAYAWWRGAKVTEVSVNHRPRRAGRSKYGLTRIFKVILDLMLMKFMHDYSAKPIRLFGGIGLLLNGAGVIIAGVVLYQKHTLGYWAHKNPLLLLAVFLFLLGVQLVMIGLVAELTSRIYFSTTGQRVYAIEKTAGFGDGSEVEGV